MLNNTTCLHCNSRFVKNRVNQKLCSYKCRLDYQRKQYRRNALKEVCDLKSCVICGKDFIANDSRTKTCSPKCRKIWRHQYQVAYKAERRGFTLKLRWDILCRDNFTCQYCGKKAPDIELHVDHIISKFHGGSNKPSNLCVACIKCNLGKERTNAPVAFVTKKSGDAYERLGHIKIKNGGKNE